MKRLRIQIWGRVQGVFFRTHTQAEATKLNLVGWVRNCPDGTVEIVAEGNEKSLTRLLDWCRTGPPKAQVLKIEPAWDEAEGEFESFIIKYE